MIPLGGGARRPELETVPGALRRAGVFKPPAAVAWKLCSITYLTASSMENCEPKSTAVDVDGHGYGKFHSIRFICGLSPTHP